MILRHIASILALPVTVAIVIPWLLLRSGTGPGDAPPPMRILGLAAASVGLVLAISTIRDFATRGRGTLAPWDPPRRLVLSGPYRHVRNPMISGMILILLGETLWFASPALAAWTAFAVVLNAVYIPLVEEKSLVRRFGQEYEEYRRSVPRWVPRVSAWWGGKVGE